MKGLNIVVHDVETKELIPNLVPGQFRDLTEEDFKFMGVASIVLYDFLTDDYMIGYDEASQRECVERINSADMVSGFNIIKFDHNVLRAAGLPLKPEAELPTYDPLYHSRRACGWTEESERYPGGLKLDNHLEGTFGRGFMKTGPGADAPGLFKAGLTGKLLTYNTGDTKREKMLLEHIWTYGWVRTERHGLKQLEWPQKTFRRRHGA